MNQNLIDSPLPSPDEPRLQPPAGSILGLSRRTALFSALLGVAYAIFARLAFDSDLDGVVEIMSVSFLFVAPIVAGFIPLFLWPVERAIRVRDILLVPAAITLVTMGIALLFALEGFICVIIWAPIFLIMSIVGASIGAIARRIKMPPSSRSLVLASVLALPYVLSPLEQRHDPAPQLDVIENSIIIDADAATIWENIRAVPPIGADEYESTFTHAIGFPKPIAATIDRDGVGAVRHATFEGGVVFYETITEWEPLERLSFTIDPSADIPPTTFDEHVVVGGKYFDVLTGSYRLERLGERRYRLHLRSEHRLGTRFNWYTRIWTRLFMGEIQESILGVVRGRCEGR